MIFVGITFGTSFGILVDSNSIVSSFASTGGGEGDVMITGAMGGVGG